MSSQQSGLEALIFGIPAVGMLFAFFFRLDQLFEFASRKLEVGHPLSHRSQDGNIVCIEPDGRYCVEAAGSKTPSYAKRLRGHLPRRGAMRPVRRVTVVWETDRAGE